MPMAAKKSHSTENPQPRNSHENLTGKDASLQDKRKKSRNSLTPTTAEELDVLPLRRLKTAGVARKA